MNNKISHTHLSYLENIRFLSLKFQGHKVRFYASSKEECALDLNKS